MPELTLLAFALAGLAFLALAGLSLFIALRLRSPAAAEAARAAREEALQRQILALLSTQNELSGRVRQLSDMSVEAQARVNAAQTELTAKLEERLEAVSLRLGQNLSENTEKTVETLGHITTRLSLIDEAQKNITALSRDVVGLQDILANKQARGAFGEVQLEDIVRKALAPDSYAFQHTLSNRARVDCLIRLPAPPGPLPVDAKFPLESYRAIRDAADDKALEAARRQFRQDVTRHAEAIASRYLIAGETAASALMFLPSEAVYAELHSGFLDVVDKCLSLKVYPVSPTTLMATLHTVRAIVKDARMHEQAGVIQKEVGRLMEDVRRFQERVDALQKHVGQTETDVRQIVTSAEKIVKRAEKIAEVDLGSEPEPSAALQGLARDVLPTNAA
ncbi:MAG: DNA recombination protein RmuC [Alphaproteobacteria bacterium]|nr:DNA recombination protein RmuC [Alphaproteobacteria bacterium]